MSEVEYEVTVQTGNLVKPPQEDGTGSEWAVTQEWKLKVSSTLTAEGSPKGRLTELIAKTCNNNKRTWPHEISLHGEKPVVLRQGKENLTAIGIKDGSVLRFWNGKWAI